MRIDHVLWATRDLDAAADRFEHEHGLRVSGGGRHDGHGTHNRIIPLGGGYLELIGVADAVEAAGSPVGAAVAAAQEGLMGWAVAVEDVGAHATRLGVPLWTIARSGLTARLAGVGEALETPTLPFFIERDPGIRDPGAEGDAGGIATLEVAGDPTLLHDWLGDAAPLPVRVAAGEPAVRAVHLGSGTVIR